MLYVWRELHQLAPNTVGSLEGAGVQEVVVAPVLGLAILLVRVVHIEKRQMIPCSNMKFGDVSNPPWTAVSSSSARHANA